MFYANEELIQPLIALGSIIVAIILMFVLGFIAHVLGENRGFTRTQFWWGFFLGVIGIMWVAIMPTYRVYDDEYKRPNHYAPAYTKPKAFNGKTNSSLDQKGYEKVQTMPKDEKQYWGNDIDSLPTMNNKKDE